MHDIDDLFRQELDQHQTPPPADLWARLQAAAPADDAPQPAADPADDTRVDERFRRGLAAHATPPGRHLWERLEDEHLRPRKRRAAAWWPMAVAAALLLTLGVGGLRWWQQDRLSSGDVARQGNGASAGARMPHGAAEARPGTAAPAAGAEVGPHSVAATTPAAASVAGATTSAAEVAVGREGTRRTNRAALRSLGGGNGAAVAAAGGISAAQSRRLPAPAKKYFSRQATRPGGPTSEGAMAAAGVSAPPRPASQSATPAPLPANAPAPAPVALAPAPAGSATDAPTSSPAPAPASAPLPSLASTAGVIEVDVRPGTGRPREAAPVAAAAPRGARGQRLLGGLLRQATHLVRGEGLQLAETGLPQRVTVQAHLGSHTVSKSILL